MLAFTTRSSEVTLPLHMEKLRAMGASERIVSVVLPLGYAFNRDGAIMYFALAVTFLALALMGGADPGEKYRPPKVVNGQIQPGHYEQTP